MSALALQQSTRPPAVTAQPNRQNALGRALIFAVDAGISPTPIDLVSRLPGKFVGNCSAGNGLWTTTDHASGVQFPHTRQVEQLGSQLTIVIWAAIASTAGFGRLFSQPYWLTGVSGGGPYMTWGMTAASDGLSGELEYAYTGSVRSADTNNAYLGPIASGPLHYYALSTDLSGTTVTFYKDGSAYQTVALPISGSNGFDQGQRAPINLLFDAGANGSSPSNGMAGSALRAYVFNRVLTAAEHASLYAQPYQVYAPPLTRRIYLFTNVPSSTGASGALTFAAGSATWSATGKVGTKGSTGFVAGVATWTLGAKVGTKGSVGFHAGAATWTLAAAVGTKGSIGFTAGSATWSLSAGIGAKGTVGFQSGPATLSLGGVAQPRGSTGFVAGAATWAASGTATGGGPTVGAGLIWNADTFTLAFTGSIGFQSGQATWALHGATTTASVSFRAGSATWHAAGTATPPAPPPPVAAVAFAAGPATWALHARYAIASGLSWKAGSANAPLLHAVAPQAAPPVWQGTAVNLTATRSRAGGQAVARLMLRTAAGDPLPAEPLPAGVARVTFRRASGGEPYDAAGMFEAVNGELVIAVAWPASLPFNGLYFCSVSLDGRRVPEGGRSVLVAVEA